jgi:hypothetical protein
MVPVEIQNTFRYLNDFIEGAKKRLHKESLLQKHLLAKGFPATEIDDLRAAVARVEECALDLHMALSTQAASEKRWYVFDIQDCFDNFATAAEAAACAEMLEKGAIDNAHILHLTKEQFRAYCKGVPLAEVLKM